MTNKELEILRGTLGKDEKKTLMSEFKVGSDYLRKIFRGERINEKLIARAIELAEAKKRRLDKISLRIKKLAR